MTKTFNVSFPEKLAREVDRAAKLEKRSRSELLQGATRAYLAQMSKWDEVSAKVKVQARKLGLRTIDDVDRMIHEFRAEEAERVRRASRRS